MIHLKIFVSSKVDTKKNRHETLSVYTIHKQQQKRKWIMIIIIVIIMAHIFSLLLCLLSLCWLLHRSRDRAFYIVYYTHCVTIIINFQDGYLMWCTLIPVSGIRCCRFCSVSWRERITDAMPFTSYKAQRQKQPSHNNNSHGSDGHSAQFIWRCARYIKTMRTNGNRKAKKHEKNEMY